MNSIQCWNTLFIRKKIGKKINFQGKGLLLALLNDSDAFVFISTDFGTQFTEMYAVDRGVDHIQGELGIQFVKEMELEVFQWIYFIFILAGEILSNLILSSNHQIPKEIVRRLNQLTSTLMESGLNKFYWSFARYMGKIRGACATTINTDNNQVSMKQFQFPLFIYFISMMTSILVFAAEIIYFKRQKRQRILKCTP